MFKIFSSLVALAILILVVWGLIYFKKTIAFTYFGSGVKVLNSSGDLEKIDRLFSKALKLDQSDVYWRGKAEVALVAAQKMADGVTPATSASTTQAILSEINNILNQGLASAKKATTYDPANYYNFLSEARVSEVAATVKMQNGYESAVSAYNSAINLNPYNPSVYLSLANLQARQAKYDDALQTLGKTLQVKNNYLDAVFLLSQVYAAKGDTNNAIVAAKVAVQLNPQNSILLFQLGILDYNIKDYAGAIQAFTDAIKYQPDYANAKYFLGLSHARLNHMAEAITLFEELSLKNPDNQEVALILSNLRSGRSIFTDTKAPATPAPEKRSSLPIKEKK
jgi:Flp pilus assembly protein TadD